MKIQTNTICINPEHPVRAAGYAQQVEPVSEIRDNLYARTLVIEQQGTRYVHIALDSLQAPKELMHSLKQQLQKAWGMPVCLVISGTHTHFAPDMRDSQYRQQVFRQLSKALSELEMEEAELTCSFVREPFGKIGASRISHWTTDQIFAQTLCIYNHGRRVATLLIHNCHPTVLSGDTPFFTCEYPGLAVRHLQQRYPDEFFSYLQGACGDVSTRFIRRAQTVEQMEEFGQIMADEFDSLLQRQPQPFPCRMGYQDHWLDLQHELKNPDSLIIPEYYSKRERETLVYGIEASRKNLANPEHLASQTMFSVLDFGGVRLIFSEFELFSEYNKATDPQHSALICYSQGYSHYVAGPSFDGMTYETLQDTLAPKTREAILALIRRYSAVAE